MARASKPLPNSCFVIDCPRKPQRKRFGAWFVNGPGSEIIEKHFSTRRAAEMWLVLKMDISK